LHDAARRELASPATIQPTLHDSAFLPSVWSHFPRSSASQDHATSARLALFYRARIHLAFAASLITKYGWNKS